MGVDIIIPIYNAYDDLCKCLQSVYQYTDLVKNRLILINDNSSDTRIEPYLNSQTKENIIIIHNNENKGFSNNINLGMDQSKERDVILLNSDTIVTKNWVEKIVECAYSDRAIGTVTPLSNNATLCSVPNFCEENSLPEGMNIDQVAAIVEDCSLKKYPRITVAHGFCMFIKREVINTIGNFDAETFGRGYGEENDFCNRAEQMGYIHVMCDDTYIYHSGTKSFMSEEKEAYIKEHDRILNERYPQQMHNNAVHCQKNPNGWVGRNIAFHLDIWNGKKNILYLLQSDFREGADDNVGGTQLHVKHLTMGLRKDMNIFVAARDREYLQVTVYTANSEYIFRFYIGEKETFPLLRNRKLADIFRMILLGFKIDFVHVHHTSTTSLDIFYEANKLGIPIIFTAHDFYYVCPNEKLLDYNGDVCIEKKDKNCERCLKERKGICEKNQYLSMWRRVHGEVLGMCKYIITPSDSTKEVLEQYYSIAENKIIVIEHGLDKMPIIMVEESKIEYTNKFSWKIEKCRKSSACVFVCGIALWCEKVTFGKIILRISDKNGNLIYLPTTYGRNIDVLHDENRFYAYIPNDLSEQSDLKIEAILYKRGCFYMNINKYEKISRLENTKDLLFRVAFIGGLNEEKGGKLVSEIVRKGSSDIEWFVIGEIGENSLFQLKQENLIKVCSYYQEDLPTWLNYYKIDVICILSKWPETFSYTLSEAVVNHIPVIVTDIGALGERVRNNGYGITVSVNNAVYEVIHQIDLWKSERTKYKELKNYIQKLKYKTLEEMILEYKDIYRKYNRGIIDSSAVNVKCNKVLLDAMIGDEDNISDKEIIYRVKDLEMHIKKIESSAAFKVMRKLYSLNIPFKSKIRKFILKH